MVTSMNRRDFMRAAGAMAAVPLLPQLGLAQSTFPQSFLHAIAQDAIDRDLFETSITHLHGLYDAHRYTTTQVTRWYLNRIARYDDAYRAIIHVDAKGALATAAAQDAARKSNPNAKRGPLWGVPIVIKANTSVKGLVTNGGWAGFNIAGRELIAPADATIVRKLKAAGAIILGQTNMPDFAGGDMTISTTYGRTGNAYDPRFSPGGSSGGTVTAVAANFCVFGNGTDTGNSIRMPAGTSSLVGLLPTRGLVSIAGILPLDWLLDNAGPIARSVTDVAIALDVMAGEDVMDYRTKGSAAEAQPGPYTKYLNARALSGKRFGVPAFIVKPAGDNPNAVRTELQPEARALFNASLDALRAAGATIVIDDSILPDSFSDLIGKVNTRPYIAEGYDIFLHDFGPARYHSMAEYAHVIGSPLPPRARGMTEPPQPPGPAQLKVESDPGADATLWQPRQNAYASYAETLDRLQLDGYVYPAVQMPPNDETIGLEQGQRSTGPHSRTGWVNRIGVPAIVVPAGFYASGLPFGLEIATKRWRDGDLIGWAFSYEQATKSRRPPRLVEKW